MAGRRLLILVLGACRYLVATGPARCGVGVLGGEGWRGALYAILGTTACHLDHPGLRGQSPP
jgi:hypothetical protein